MHKPHKHIPHAQCAVLILAVLMTLLLVQLFAVNTINPHSLTVRTFHSFVEFANISSLKGLFAPRQGQAFREEQRRRRSQFDRGTPGAEYEAYNNRLADPALSPIHPPYTPGSTVNGSNLGSFTGHVYGPPPAFPNHGYY